MHVFPQSRMAAFSARRARPSTGRKQARSLPGRWSTTSSLTVSPDTQTPRPFASSTTFLPGSRSELRYFAETPPFCHRVMIRLSSLSLCPFSPTTAYQLELIAAAACWCRRMRCKSLRKRRCRQG